MSIVFTATKHHSEYVHELFIENRYQKYCGEVEQDQAVREERLKSFRNGKANYLIVTDLAARGIDIPLLNNVINLHFPMSSKLFRHRCGTLRDKGRIGFASEPG